MEKKYLNSYRIIIAIIFLFPINFLGAQSKNQPTIDNSIIPPSPEVASLEKYGVIPTTLYTGQPNISVPFMDIHSTRIDIPISLSYNYNGYRLGEEASWIGLGWTLQAGGAITRVVKGKLDEGTSITTYLWQNYANITDLMGSADFMKLVGLGYVDTEPDIYIFNFNGHSGKFIVVGNRVFMLPKQDLMIVNNNNRSTFTIYTNDGTRYDFNDIETSTTPNIPALYNTSWFLSRIISADYSDTVNFNYTTYSHTPTNIFTESYTVQVGGQGSNNSACTNATPNCDSWSVNTLKSTTITTKRLTGITCKTATINFVPESTARSDDASSSSYALHEIDVYNPFNNSLVRKIQFAHSYFKDISSNPTQLKLDGVNITGYNNTGTDSSTQGYSFQYNNPAGTYPKNTRGIDKFGYYNGKDGNYTLFDTTITGRPLLYPSADRTVNTLTCSNGLLTQITYPTGGYTVFNYENNKIYNSQVQYSFQTNPVYTSINYTTGTGDSSLTSNAFYINISQNVTFNYGRLIDSSKYPNGILNTHRVLRIFKLTNPYYNPTGQDSVYTDSIVFVSQLLGKALTTGSTTLQLSPGSYFYQLVCDASSLSSYVQFNYNIPIGAYVGDPGPGMRIASILSYDNINLSSPALSKYYNYGNGGTPLSLNGYGQTSTQLVSCSPSTSITFTSNSSTPLSTIIGDAMYYPCVTETNYNGNNYGKTVYQFASDGTDALGVYLVQQNDSAYINNSFLPQRIKTYIYNIGNYIIFSAFTYYQSQLLSTSSCQPDVPLLVYNIYDTIPGNSIYTATPYSILSTNNLLQSTDESVYNLNGQNPINTHTAYYYDNPNYLTPSRTVLTRSTGDTLTTLIKYPLDYNYNNCQFLYSIDSAFVAQRNAVTLAYEQCETNRYNAFYPVWSQNPPAQPSSPMSQAALNILRSYPCETNYYTASANLLINLNNMLNSYNNCMLPTFPSSLTDPQLAITLMQAHNIMQPVERIISIRQNGVDNLTDATKKDYTVGYMKNAFSELPKIIYKAEPSLSNTLPTLNTFLSNTSAYYQPRLNLTYDVNTSNTTEQYKQNDMHYVYIWGYNSIYPVAKIEGTTYDTAISLINSSTYNATTTTDAAMRSELNKLRTALPGALVTTYTYAPLFGITSETDPLGRTTYYEYDGLARLQRVRDQDNNILKQYSYKLNYTGIDAINPSDTITNQPSMVTLSCTNNEGSGYKETYTNVNTGQSYTFNISASGGTIGSIPPGTYNVTFTPPSGVTYMSLYTICSYHTSSKTAVTIQNVSITQPSCNISIIDGP